MSISDHSELEPLVIFDGECGFCSRAIQFILRHEKGDQLKFCTRQSARARQILANYSVDLDNLESIVLIESGRVWLYSDATLKISGYLRPPWKWIQFGLWVPRLLREPAYKLIAKNRNRISSKKKKHCLLLNSQQSVRFVC